MLCARNAKTIGAIHLTLITSRSATQRRAPRSFSANTQTRPSPPIVRRRGWLQIPADATAGEATIEVASVSDRVAREPRWPILGSARPLRHWQVPRDEIQRVNSLAKGARRAAGRSNRVARACPLHAISAFAPHRFYRCPCCSLSEIRLVASGR